jgi:siroheme synthase (precorrin-2 oxidase/ferrochelatase)
VKSPEASLMIREDIESVFKPIFDQILKLVREQIEVIKNKYREKLKVASERKMTDFRQSSSLEVLDQIYISGDSCRKN